MIRKLSMFLLLLPFFANAQSLRHSVSGGVNSSIYAGDKRGESIYDHFNKDHLGIRFQYNVEHELNENWTLGTSLGYEQTNGILTHYLHVISIGFSKHGLRNELKLHQMDIPFFLKWKVRGDHSLYLNSEAGLSILVSSYREIYEIGVHPNGNKKERERIKEGNFDLNTIHSNRLNGFFQFGIGHTFKISGVDLFAELGYKKELVPWNYEKVRVRGDGKPEIQFNRSSFQLTTGVLLN